VCTGTCLKHLPKVGLNTVLLAEVLGRYSNHADQGKRISRVLQMVPQEPLEPITRTIRQVHRRLLPAQIDELVACYQGGATLRELSEQFQIHRASISIVLDRQNVPGRYRMVEGERLEGAIRDYNNGDSIISIANKLGVAG
jgi:hypothetical protein